MRRDGKRRQKSTEEKSPSNASLDRLKALEDRVSALEAVGELPWDSADQVAPKRGRPPKIDTAALLGRRDELVSWLEAMWPQFAAHLMAARDAKAVRAALADYLSENCARYISERADAFCEFVTSSRFRRKPPERTASRALNGNWMKSEPPIAAMRLPTRQIASALAGVPELTWRTSLDRCMEEPCQIAVGQPSSIFLRIAWRVPWPKSVWDQAEQGMAHAQYWVGLSCANGLGVEKNARAAAAWFQRAAVQGNGDAQFELANAYLNGSGVSKSIPVAYIWAALVPMEPRHNAWKNGIENKVPEGDLPRLKQLKQELFGLIQWFQVEQRNRPGEQPQIAAKQGEEMNALFATADPLNFRPMDVGQQAIAAKPKTPPPRGSKHRRTKPRGLR